MAGKERKMDYIDYVFSSFDIRFNGLRTSFEIAKREIENAEITMETLRKEMDLAHERLKPEPDDPSLPEKGGCDG